MQLKVSLAWKIVVGAPEPGVDYRAANKHFNIKTGKTFVRKLGGVSSLDFYPFTFDPTNVFYNAIESCKLANGFTGKKLPFEGALTGSKKIKISIKIHQYSSDLVILSVSSGQIDFNGDIGSLKNLISIETHEKLLSLIKTICSIITSGGARHAPVQRKLKIYPCIELESSTKSESIEDKAAVELLTRHANAKAGIVDSVISKNSDHQLDNNSILVDRQGILARYFTSPDEMQSICRKFESTHYLFELAVSIAHILETNSFLALNSEQRSSVINLVNYPNIVFTKSVTAYKTWQLLLSEFKLVELYEHVVSQNMKANVPAPTTEKKWSELKTWVMSIIAAIAIGLVLWGVDIFYKEIGSNKDETISLLQPLDDTRLDSGDKEIKFGWKSVSEASKYILLIEKYSPIDGKWIPSDDGGRYIALQANILVPINHVGSFKWKIIAKDSNEKSVAESTWYFFKITSGDLKFSQKLNFTSKEEVDVGASDNP